MKYSKAFVILTGFFVTTAAPAFSQEALGVIGNEPFIETLSTQSG
jgi:hypothetical protein